MSEKKAECQTTPTLPAISAIEPCATEVGFNLAVYYRYGVACQRCRYWLIEVTTMSDQEPVYIHGHKIPPEIHQGEQEHTKKVVAWIEKRYFEKLQSRESWGKDQAIEQFRETLAELLFELLGSGKISDKGR